jgi:hypothetical protein
MNMDVHKISNYLIRHSSIFNSSSIFEHYIVEIRQPNNYITLLPIHKQYTFETFMDDLNDFDLNNAQIKIKMNDETQTVKIFDFKSLNVLKYLTNDEVKEIKDKNNLTLSNIIKNYYDIAIDIIFIFYYDDTINISYDEFKKLHLSKYYKRHYIIHCQNIHELSMLISRTQLKNSNKEIRKLEDSINYLKEKNLTLCQQLDELKLSSQDNIQNKINECLKLQLEYENLQHNEDELKTKVKKYKIKLKKYININKNLNNEILRLRKENKNLKADNDEFYIAIVNGHSK